MATSQWVDNDLEQWVVTDLDQWGTFGYIVPFLAIYNLVAKNRVSFFVAKNVITNFVAKK